MTRKDAQTTLYYIAINIGSGWLLQYILHSWKITIIVGAFLLVVYGLAIKFNLVQWAYSILHLQAIVISTLVFDYAQERVLLVKDDRHQPPWLAPPSAHAWWWSIRNGGPHQAVIRIVKDEAGIDIKIPGQHQIARTVKEIPHPFYAQTEKQDPGEGHSYHHDFYYIGFLASQRGSHKPRGGKYEWVKVCLLKDLEEMTVPPDLHDVIQNAYKVSMPEKRAKNPKP